MLPLKRKGCRSLAIMLTGGVIWLNFLASACGQEQPKPVDSPLSSFKILSPPNATSAKQTLPQEWLSILGSKDVGRLEELLSAGADPNCMVAASGRTLLMAAQSGSMVRLLLEHGADPGIRDDKGATALHYAVTSPEALEIVPLLIEKGADVNAADDMGFTALISAVVNDKPDLVRLMLERGADPTIRTHDDQSALDWAQDLGIVDLVHLLEDAYAHR
jgi:ankyrin repeat protein